MPAIAYPDTLPGPLPGSMNPRPRRAASAIEGPLLQRARQRDFAGALSRYAFIYTPAQMATWLEWFRDVLLQGRRWFAIALPGAGGLVNRVARYHEVQQEHLGAGIYRVNATFEQRGAAVEPFGSLPEDSYAYYSLSAGDFDHGPLCIDRRGRGGVRHFHHRPAVGRWLRRVRRWRCHLWRVGADA